MEDDRRTDSISMEMVRLVGVVDALREHCPWTAALTPAALTTYLLEESHELIEAIETARDQEIVGELGDILLQVVLHARLGEESSRFDLSDVASGLSEKLIRRSPHVFHADGSLQETFPATVSQIEASWERVKATERAAAKPVAQAGTTESPAPASSPASSAGPYAGIPATLPALSMAQKSVERAARAGLDLPTPAGSLANQSETEDELGRVLFDVVLAAQKRGLDAERALRIAVRKFQDQ